MNENFKHELYTKVENEKDADALAWALGEQRKSSKVSF